MKARAEQNIRLSESDPISVQKIGYPIRNVIRIRISDPKFSDIGSDSDIDFRKSDIRYPINSRRILDIGSDIRYPVSKYPKYYIKVNIIYLKITK